MSHMIPEISNNASLFLSFGNIIKSELITQGIPARNKFHIKKIKCIEPVLYILNATNNKAKVLTDAINMPNCSLFVSLSFFIMVH